MSERRRKILFVNGLDDPKDGAGAERSINTLMQALKNAGHDIAIASTSDVAGIHRHDRAGIRIWRAGIKNIYWPKREARRSWPMRRIWHALDSYNWFMRKQLEAIIEIERPDIISLHTLPGWSVAAVDAVSAKGIPAVQVLHDYYYACPNTLLFKANKNCAVQCVECRLLRLPHRRLSSKVDAVIGLSKFSLNKHIELGYFKDVGLKRVVNNTRSSEALRLPEAAALRIQADTERTPGIVRFGFIGSLAPSKGIELLLQSFVKLNAGNAELLIAGSGDASYVETLKRNFAAPKIQFLGQVMQYQFYPKVDFTVVPSQWQDTLPMVVPESLAYGIPVIGSRRGGIPEVIVEGTNGFIFEPDIPDDLERVMLSILKNEGYQTGMSEAARQSSLPFLDIESWVAEYQSIYQEIGGS